MIIKRIAPWLLFAVLSSIAFLWWQRSRSSTGTATVFRTATIQRGEVSQTVTASGSLSAITTVEVGSQVSGNIAKLYVDYNDAVQAGQLIAEIEPTSYQARLVQAEADLLSTQATLELKQLNARRSAELLAKSLLSQSDNDQAMAELHQQEAAMKKNEAAVKSARVDLDRCKITSPIDGVVLSRAIDVGQTVQSNFSTPTLFKLAQDLRQMEITANISEADIGDVGGGQSVSFTVDAFPGRTFAGTVREVRNNSTTVNNVVTYPTIVTVDNSDLKLRPGMTANITICTARRSGVLRVANAALRYKPADTVAVRKAEPAATDIPKTPTAGRPPNLPPAGAPAGPVMAGSVSAPAPKMIYVLASPPDASGRAAGELTATPVLTGLSDSAWTEIVSGVNEGALVVTGTTTAQAAAAATTSTNPFMPSRPPGGGPPPH